MLVLIPIVIFIIIFAKYPCNFSIIINVNFIFFSLCTIPALFKLLHLYVFITFYLGVGVMKKKDEP